MSTSLNETPSIEVRFIWWLLYPLRLAWSAFVFMKLWAWFMVPVFPQLRVLSLWEAMGLDLFVAFLLTAVANYSYSDKEPHSFYRSVGLNLGYLVILGIGAVLRFWVM